MITSTGIAIRNILLPTDFSDESAQAVQYVLALRRHFGANVHVVHVLDTFPFSLSSDAAAIARTNEVRQTADLKMNEFAQRYSLNGEGFDSMLLSGEVSSAIDDFTHHHEIDLIVLGSRGDVGMNRLFQGSMAEEIFRTAHCPVMIAGPKTKQPAGGEVFNRLLFATDMSIISEAALPYIEFLLADNPATRVSLAHFVEQEPGTPFDRHRLRKHFQQELANLITPSLRDRIGEVIVECAPPANGMIEAARNLPADLLVLGVRYGGSFTRAATHGLCSITHQIISQSPCPVLTVRAV
jgi:nucleotide-binding universal stress UspA family protein